MNTQKNQTQRKSLYTKMKKRTEIKKEGKKILKIKWTNSQIELSFCLMDCFVAGCSGDTAVAIKCCKRQWFERKWIKEA